jgi:flagella basal body P-ring formation protein FlgA
MKWRPLFSRWVSGVTTSFFLGGFVILASLARSEVRPMVEATSNAVTDSVSTPETVFFDPNKPAASKSAISRLTGAAKSVDMTRESVARISVDMRQIVDVEGSRLLLEQVASCNPSLTSGFDCEEILAVDLGTSPLPGKSGRISRSHVKEVLASEFPQAAINVAGSDTAFVSARGVVLDPESITAPLTNQLEEAFAGASDFRLQVIGVRINGRPMVRPGDVICRFAQVDMIRMRTGSADSSAVAAEIENFMTRIQNGAQLNAYCAQGEEEAPIHIQFTPKLQVERRMPVAASDLAPKSIFRASDATWAWVPWVRSASRALRDPSTLAGLAVVRPVQAGQLLLLRDFERPLAIRRGDAVQLLQRNGGLVVTTNAVAMSQGAIGDAVEVQSVATRKRIRAVIQSSTSVEAM